MNAPTHHPKSLSNDFEFLQNQLTSRNALKNKISLKHSEGKGNLLMSSAENTYRHTKYYNNKTESTRISALRLTPNTAIKIKNHDEEFDDFEILRILIDYLNIRFILVT